MSEPARRRATYQDVLEAPPHVVAELIDGELTLQPRPGKPHAAAASALGEELGPPFKRGRGGPGGWILLFEPELHLGDDVVVPDLGGWRRERLPALVADTPYFDLAPDWIAEMLSPGTERRDRGAKLRAYARAGVPYVWFVNPITRTLEVLVLGPSHEAAVAQFPNGAYTVVATFEGDARIRAVPFAAFELELGLLWADVVLPVEPE